MTARLTRLGNDRGPWAVLFSRRKPGLQPMSAEDARINAELHRRREQRRKEREVLQ